jgi:hypothetical protein
VELAWVQDPGSSPMSSRRLPINTLTINYTAKVEGKKIIHINILEKNNNVVHANFLLDILCGLKIEVA